MAKYVIDENTLKGIGDAIRAKKGTSDPIPVPNLASEISSIESGGSTNTYNGTIWKFRDNITFGEILAFADEYWQEEFGEYNFSFRTPFTTDVLLEDVDGEYSTQFSSIAMYGDSNYIIVEMYPVNGAPVDLAYYDTDSGGEWKNHFTMTLDAEPSAEDLVFLQTFADMIGSSDKPDAPTYNGYIPLGKYVLATDEVIEELYLEPEPYVSDDTSWFKCSVGSLSVYNFINARPDSGSIVAGWYADGTEVSLSVGDTIEVIEQVEVDEETLNLFMHYFTPQE